MDICKHEFENENCTNCANGLPCSAYLCAKTKGELKEFCHERAEEIHKKYYQQGRQDTIDELMSRELKFYEELIANEDITEAVLLCNPKVTNIIKIAIHENKLKDIPIISTQVAEEDKIYMVTNKEFIKNARNNFILRG